MSMKVKLSLVILLVLGGVALCGEEITTVEIADISAEFAGRDGSDIISGSGLNINGPGTHSNHYADMWWVGPNAGPVEEQFVIFDLGGVYALDTIRIWNFNELYTGHPTFGDSNGQRGIKEMEILVSVDGETYTNLGTFALDPAWDSDTVDFSQDVTLEVEARFVQFDVLSNHSEVDPSVGLAEVRFFGTALSVTPAGFPSPADAASGVASPLVLSWTPGALVGDVNGHDVYFGTDYMAVEQADTSSPVYQGRYDVKNFDPGALDSGRFYFWRVDQVNEDLNQVVTGDVWTFTTPMDEDAAVAPVTEGLVLHLDGTVLSGIASGVKLKVWPGRAKGNDATAGGDNQAGTVISDGLNGQPVIRFSGTSQYYSFPEVNDVRTVLWVLREDADAVTDWDFILGHSGSYHFHRGRNKTMWFPTVSHQAIIDGETRINWEVVDGSAVPVPTTWSLVSLVTTDDVEANTLSQDRHFGGRGFDGDMAEVLIYNRPLEEAELQQMAEYLTLKWDLATPFSPKAGQPVPASGAGNVDYQATLIWSPGVNTPATQGHDVYFGTDINEVTTATPDSPAYMGRYDNSQFSVKDFDPDALIYDMTYYWRVDQVNEGMGEVWAGEVWFFTVANYAVLENFDSYTSDEELRAVWWDWEAQEKAGRIITSAGVSLDTSGNALRARSGQSMVYFYENNEFEPYYSETQRVFNPSRDFTQTTAGEHRALVLHFRGATGNPAAPFEPLYVRVVSGATSHTVFYDTPGDLIWEGRNWQQWRIDFNDFTDNGVDLGAVTELVIGVGDQEGLPATADGVFYVDDILLGTAAFLPPVVEEPNAPETYEVVPQAPSDGPAIWYKFDGDVVDSAGSFNGSLAGGARFVTDPDRGQVLALDGGDWVDFPAIATDWTNISISVWLKLDQVPGQWTALMSNNGHNLLFYQFNRDILQFHFPGGNVVTSQTSMVDLVGKWANITVTHNGQQKVMYINGFKDAERNVAAVDALPLGPGRIGSWSLDPNRDLVAQVDDVQIFNRALTHEEAASLAGLTEPFAHPVPAQ